MFRLPCATARGLGGDTVSGVTCVRVRVRVRCCAFESSKFERCELLVRKEE